MLTNLYAWLYRWSLRKWRKAANNNDIKKKHPRITDHALIRYAERIGGYDFKKAENIMLSEAVERKINEHGGNGRFTVDGVMYVVNEGVIRTVYKPSGLQLNMEYSPLGSKRGRRWSF